MNAAGKDMGDLAVMEFTTFTALIVVVTGQVNFFLQTLKSFPIRAMIPITDRVRHLLLDLYEPHLHLGQSRAVHRCFVRRL